MTSDMDDLLTAIMRFDIVAYVTGIGATEIQSKGEWELTCPSCGKDKLLVNIEKKTWHCWVCQEYVDVITTGGVKRRAISGAGGLVDLIQVLENVDRVTAVRKVLAAGYMTPNELAHLPETFLPPGPEAWDDEDPAEIPLPDCCTQDFRYDGLTQSMLAVAYLQQRGISLADVQKFGLHWCFGGQHANRLVFPVYESGRLIYWQARAMWEQQPGERYIKSLNPPRTRGAAVSSEVLMNLDTARGYSRVAITEGPIDCVHVGADAVCSFGKQLSSVQIGKLIRAGVRAVDLFWDADAFKAAVQVARSLTALFDVRIVRLPHGDPGDFTREQNAWYREQAQRLPGVQVLV